jgi:hypothetical protein
MTLDEAIDVVQAHVGRINELYGKSAFDEWALLAILGDKGRILRYEGPRREDFQKRFAEDVHVFGAELRNPLHNIGDFHFARHGVGTRFDAFLVVGEGLYLICNNTGMSMTMVTQDPLWLSAQVPFVEMSDRFRSDPLVYPM